MINDDEGEEGRYGNFEYGNEDGDYENYGTIKRDNS